MFKAIRRMIDERLTSVNVCYPAIIRSFDSVCQTIEAEVAIKRLDGSKVSLLVDVPISLPTVQGFHLTMPIKSGDECIIVFSDRCIDEWFIKGGVQKQSEHRVHHLSDAFALIGVNSKPNVISNYNANDAELRNTAGDQFVRLKADKKIQIDTPTEVEINCDSADINCDTATIDATTKIDSTTPIWTQDGDMHIDGNITFTGSMIGDGSKGNGDAYFVGKIDTTGDIHSEVLGKNTSLSHHDHPGDSGGTTGQPN